MTHDVQQSARRRVAMMAERAFGLTAVALPRRSGDRAATSAPNASGADAETGLPRPTADRAPPAAEPTRLSTTGYPAVGVQISPGLKPAVAKPAVAKPPGVAKPPSAARSPAAAVVAAGGISLPTRRTAPIAGARRSTAEKVAILEDLNDSQVRGCVRCGLCEGRTHTVFGEGSVDADIMFIGEGPGEEEDLSGRPFVGRSGELLTRMITGGMGLRREDVYIANIVKCRPPGNRTPTPVEALTCSPYLETQIEIIRPRAIITLGVPATKFILNNEKVAITRLRGTWHDYRGIKVMPTFHPSYILRQYTPDTRRQVWGDLQAVLIELNLPVPMQKS